MRLAKNFSGVFVIVLAMLTTACPQGTAIQKAAKAADTLPKLTDSVIVAVGGVYDAHVITLAQKDVFVRDCQKIIDGGRLFDSAIKAANAANDNSASTLNTLNTLFSNGVVAPFLSILENLKVLSPQNGATVLTALNLVRAAILTISAIFTQAGYHTGAEVLYEHNA
jgi:hypothetical protein